MKDFEREKMIVRWFMLASIFAAIVMFYFVGWKIFLAVYFWTSAICANRDLKKIDEVETLRRITDSAMSDISFLKRRQ